MDYYNPTQSNVYNIAQSFNFSHVLHPLFESQRYETIALFGAYTLEEGQMLTAEQRNQRRLEAIEWYLHWLKKTCCNNSFVVGKLVEPFRIMRENLESIEESMSDPDRSYRFVQYNQATNVQSYSIREPNFTNYVRAMMKVRETIIRVLNANKQIYPEIEEFDIDEIKKEIIEGG